MSIITNFAPIEFINDQFTVYRTSFSKELHEQLREKHNNTHSLPKIGNYIYHAPMLPGVLPLDGELQTISTDNEHTIVSAFLRHVLFRKVISWSGVVPTSFQPLEFFSRRSEDNLISTYIPEKYRDRIGYRKGVTLEIRTLFPDGKPLYVLVFKIFYKWDMQVPCSLLLSQKINLVGRYVCSFEYLNNVMAPIRDLRGTITNTTDHENILVSRGNKTESYKADELYLENSKTNREMILTYLLGKATSSKILTELFNTAHLRKSHHYLYEEINKIHGAFSKDVFNINNDLKFSIGQLFKEGDNFWYHKPFVKPTYIFSTDSTKSNTHSNYGLKVHGPWDKGFFTPKKPVICAFCCKTNRAAMDSFLAKFKDGIQLNRPGINPYSDGFIKRFHLSGLDLTIYDVEQPTPAKFSEAISRAISEKGRFHLAIVETAEHFKKLLHTDDPYYITKIKLLQNQIPSQDIKIENIRASDWQLSWVLNDISLAMYAKLGGNPWVIPVNQSIEHELVIGLGCSSIKENRFSKGRRVVGFTTLFSGDGTYLIGNRSRVVEYEQYLPELVENLKIAIDEVRKRYNWQKGSSVRLVFHVFKPFNKYEIKAIEEVATYFGNDHEISFAYLTISQIQPYLLIDMAQKGEEDRTDRSKLKGVWSPLRGEGVRLDDFNVLVQLTGPAEIKKYTHGGSYPVLVKLHTASSFRDIDYLSQQVFTFSSISWRGFSLSPTPVTLEYSTLIAKLLGKLEKDNSFDPDVVCGNLRFGKWFL